MEPLQSPALLLCTGVKYIIPQEWVVGCAYYFTTERLRRVGPERGKFGTP